MTEFELPKELSDSIDRFIRASGLGPKKLAENIVDLSNHYRTEANVTPWENPRTTAAYAAYFLPLNFIRNLAVLSEARKLGFFVDIDQMSDFGSGPGTTYLALRDLGVSFRNAYFVETSAEAKALFGRLVPSPEKIHWKERVPREMFKKNSVTFCSYALNELKSADWLSDCESLVILEPSTHQASRKLLELRQKLIDKGFSIWAPCTHVKGCPLLLQSGKDWCHARVSWAPPDWFMKIESFLPMKNRTLTFSYLLASRRKSEGYPENTFRITGDLLKEKGKTRIMACRGDKREFLSWLKKDAADIELDRGDIVQVSDFEEKGGELRGGTVRKL